MQTFASHYNVKTSSSILLTDVVVQYSIYRISRPLISSEMEILRVLNLGMLLGLLQHIVRSSTIYSRTPIYRAFKFLPANTSFMCGLMKILPRYTAFPDIPCTFLLPQNFTVNLLQGIYLSLVHCSGTRTDRQLLI